MNITVDLANKEKRAVFLPVVELKSVSQKSTNTFEILNISDDPKGDQNLKFSSRPKISLKGLIVVLIS